jgi:hypothetical protein
MPHLSRIAQQIRQAVRRWLPVEASPARPDHDFYIRAADFAPCCEWHSEQAFRGGRPVMERPGAVDLGARMRHYLAERLGCR